MVFYGCCIHVITNLGNRTTKIMLSKNKVDTSKLSKSELDIYTKLESAKSKSLEYCDYRFWRNKIIKAGNLV